MILTLMRPTFAASAETLSSPPKNEYHVTKDAVMSATAMATVATPHAQQHLLPMKDHMYLPESAIFQRGMSD